MGVGIPLLHHGEGRGESCPYGSLLQHRRSHAVHGGVQAHDIAGSVALRHSGSLRDVVLDDVVAEGDVVIRAGKLRKWAHRGDKSRDLGVGGWHDLPPIPEIDLEAVVLRGVVTRRHHETRVGAERAHGVGEDRGGQGAREDQGLHAGAREDLGAVARELSRHVPGVEADDRGGVLVMGEEVRRDPGCGARHGDAVHAVRARPHAAAQSSRAERERPAEGIGDLRRRIRITASGRVDESAQGLACGGIGVVAEPPLG